MEKAIGSRITLSNLNNALAYEFNTCVFDLINDESVKQLDDFNQHLNTSRLQHSVNVSYYSYLVCRFLGFDYKSAARAGLLHDLYLYDWRTEKQPEGYHAKAHPRVALRNAKKITPLNKVEADCILRHMWPLTIVPPKYKESVVVSLVDKYCACVEIISKILRRR